MEQIQVTFPDKKVALFEVPTDWNELLKKELLYIADKWQSWQLTAKNGIDFEYAKTLLFVSLLRGKPIDKYRLLTNTDKVNPEDLCASYYLVDFVFQSLNLTKNIIPTIRVGLRKFYGPSDLLGNCSLNEFNSAVTYFNRYSNSGLEEHLDLFVLSLYRPKKLFSGYGDPRKEFRLEAVDRYVKQMQRVPFETKLAVWLFFYGCMEKLTTMYSEAFEKKSGKSKVGNFGWTNIVLGMAGNKFGDFDKTGQQNIHVIFMEMVNLALGNPEKNDN